jgi:outer membrane protein insertion porin family
MRSKQAIETIQNMMHRYILALVIAFLSAAGVQAQTDTLNIDVDNLPILDYTDKKQYEIADIKVIGATSRDRNAIKSIAGFAVGKQITIPGDDISNALKSLWRLRLFEDVKIIQEKVEGDLVYLVIYLKERPTLGRFTYNGIKKSHHDDLDEILDNVLNKGSIVTNEQKNLASKKIKEFYIEKGKLDTEVSISEVPEEEKENSVKLVFDIDLNERVKVEDITFGGNNFADDKKLRSKMKNTKIKGTFLRKTKFVPPNYDEDKESIIAYYNTEGYRDAKIIKDSLWREDDGDLMIKIWVDEGRRYYFRNIIWKGNTKYTDEQLSTVLGVSKGDVFNPEILDERLNFSLDGRDISSLYLDYGHLRFNVDPVEVAVVGDSIDIEMRVTEGPEFTIGNVFIEGNTKTNEHVVRRTLRTRPGQKFRRSDIIRSQREIINLGYFNPEALGVQPIVNPERGTVDVLYTVEERPADQLELSAGYGGFSGLIGTLGVTFNNFSIANIKDRSTWSPLPQGDGQKLSLRAQSNSRFFKSFNFSFTEPWLGGKKPNSFTIGAVRSSFDYSTLDQGFLAITRGFIGLGSQLSWPDDFFASSTTLNLETIELDDYFRGGFFVENENKRLIPVTDGNIKNFSIRQVIARSSVSEPLYPRSGSKVQLTIQLTPPYSLFRKDGFYELTEAEKEKVARDISQEFGPRNPPTEQEIQDAITAEENSRKFQWLEYHKWRFDAEWYFNIFDKFVLAANAKIGYVGAYNSDIGLTPFERFELGGDGLSNQNVGITGKDIIALRGYEVSDLVQNNRGGATIFDKFTLELRYPLSLNPSSTIYLHTFLQGGNAWGNFDDFNPFDMRRSVGGGLRVFLPMFGLLGFDYGFGIDKQLTGDGGYGKFSIVLGFEPD